MQYRGIVRAAQAVQSLPLARRELAAAPDGKAPEPQGAKLDAPEAQHRMAQTRDFKDRHEIFLA